MAYRCGKWRVYVGNGWSISETAKIYVGNDVDLWEMAPICGETAELFDKRLKNVENDSEIWEMAKIFGKCLR